MVQVVQPLTPGYFTLRRVDVDVGVTAAVVFSSDDEERLDEGAAHRTPAAVELFEAALAGAGVLARKHHPRHGLLLTDGAHGLAALSLFCNHKGVNEFNTF